MTNPQHTNFLTRAAWDETGGDVKKATELLESGTWQPSPSYSSSSKEQAETGRVKEVDEAHKASRIAAKEKAKKSSIYANRAILDARVQKPSTPPPPLPVKPVLDITESPTSPALALPRRRRLKRVLDSESEAEFGESEQEERSSPPVKSQNNVRSRALEFLNSAGIESLQELTGMPWVSFHCSNTKPSNLKVVRRSRPRS
jgi:SWI/SNF-related matrix-associated actin-dependent regulator 1 of chromatin subfamily A